MYSKRGRIGAHCILLKCQRNLQLGGILWSMLLAGYALHHYSEEALDLLASLDYSKQAHAGIVAHGFGLDTVANTTLVDIYSKWERVTDFEHGWEIFQAMDRDCKAKTQAIHYGCVIEFLGREGLLDEGFALKRAIGVSSHVDPKVILPRLKAMTWNMANQDTAEVTEPMAVINLKGCLMEALGYPGELRLSNLNTPIAIDQWVLLLHFSWCLKPSYVNEGFDNAGSSIIGVIVAI
ncbi:hypothetical protein GH714_024161 [Hevea brasiliensis]|uniref:DYW domain-containing protein n=1 Tax=Hevea brasiliensis TaxID=3981 RepID=A0A6A6MH43_HEVBR|nr:hypothetical protein GH714_024161 [Hevea brasiliensis]